MAMMDECLFESKEKAKQAPQSRLMVYLYVGSLLYHAPHRSSPTGGQAQAQISFLYILLAKFRNTEIHGKIKFSIAGLKESPGKIICYAAG